MCVFDGREKKSFWSCVKVKSKNGQVFSRASHLTERFSIRVESNLPIKLCTRSKHNQPDASPTMSTYASTWTHALVTVLYTITPMFFYSKDEPQKHYRRESRYAGLTPPTWFFSILWLLNFGLIATSAIVFWIHGETGPNPYYQHFTATWTASVAMTILWAWSEGRLRSHRNENRDKAGIWLSAIFTTFALAGFVVTTVWAGLAYADATVVSNLMIIPVIFLAIVSASLLFPTYLAWRWIHASGQPGFYTRKML